jgi:hypothetical protein
MVMSNEEIIKELTEDDKDLRQLMIEAFKD